MSGAVTEIVTFASYSPGIEEEQAFKVVSSQQGFLALHHGPQIENNSTGYWAVEWSSLQDHLKFQESDIYEPFVQKASAFGQVKSMVHVAFQPNLLSKVLGGPVTEVLSRTIMSSPSSEDLTSSLATLPDVLAKYKGFIGAAWGPTIEDPNLIIVLIGWESIQDSQAAGLDLNTHPLFNALAITGDMVINHARFSSYTSTA